MDFEKKINFTASYRENSPLFLRSAYNFLQKNELQNAISILKNGLQKFPEHPVAHILLGKAYLRNKDFELAELNFRNASEIINSKKTYEYYEKELKKERGRIGERDNISTVEDKKDSIRDAGKENRDEQLKDTKAIEDRLDQLAEAISSARIKRDDEIEIQKSDTKFNVPERSKIVSETLAKIYLSQGEHNEAIKVYERLIKRNPEKENYYIEKIREIRSSQS